MKKVVTNLQHRIKVPEDKKFVQGESFDYKGIKYKIGDEIHKPRILDLVNTNMGVMMTGFKETRIATSEADSVVIGIYYYRKLEGGMYAVVDVIVWE